MRVTVFMACSRNHHWRQGAEFAKDGFGAWHPPLYEQFILHCPECGRSAVRTTAYREGSVFDGRLGDNAYKVRNGKVVNP
jgi:hypothetical protein